jgi:hypothetical protein
MGALAAADVPSRDGQQPRDPGRVGHGPRDSSWRGVNLYIRSVKIRTGPPCVRIEVGGPSGLNPEKTETRGVAPPRVS